MRVSREQVEAIAALARLRLSDTEVNRLTQELGDILEHAAELAQAELPGEAVPTGDGSAPVRVDEPRTDPLSAGPESFAPAWIDGFFAVPRLESMNPGSAGDETDG